MLITPRIILKPVVRTLSNVLTSIFAAVSQALEDNSIESISATVGAVARHIAIWMNPELVTFLIHHHHWIKLRPSSGDHV